VTTASQQSEEQRLQRGLRAIGLFQLLGCGSSVVVCGALAIKFYMASRQSAAGWLVAAVLCAVLAASGYAMWRGATSALRAPPNR
jgi:hypothetical protein